MKKIGLVDIAQRAGVSTATVSRVLNQSDKVTPQTKQKVLDVVEQMKFRPNMSASALRRGRSNTIGIAVASISQPWYVKLIRALRSEITKHGFTTIVYDLEHSEKVLVEHMNNAMSLRLAGMVLATGDRLDTEIAQSALLDLSQNVPLVVIGQSTDKTKWPIVRFNDYEASKIAAEEMIAKRHKPFLMLARKEASYLGEIRIQGTLTALRNYPDLLKSSRIVEHEGAMDFDAGYRIAHEIGSDLRKFGTVVCVNDELAIGLMRAASELGLRTPKDLMLFGFGDIDVLPYLAPSISSVSGDSQQAAERSLEALFSLIHGTPHRQETVVNRTIIHRESTQVLQDQTPATAMSVE